MHVKGLTRVYWDYSEPRIKNLGVPPRLTSSISHGIVTIGLRKSNRLKGPLHFLLGFGPMREGDVF